MFLNGTKRSFDVCSRFAVGTGDGVILVYDLRTATKWRVFEALPSMVRNHDGNAGVLRLK